ncbi:MULTISPECIES: biosynthetic-type acetolactate synthase large subunit [Halobacillus]|uniref:Acetolactate synthase n=1 Tax=Halobacillus halophilus (strain ATCC 35676 / DSM 2266 / JCM 20832 / KCTC 3685 / LMG 17431 / NBRC 102448 / NCIMB 2269) TaxID=866895 RepID=I0JL96_HALH3|nr:biosynthetic-type acetolactate synthase large subunit [Halobacillus halophilus]ASF39039.1 acetolactate synthase, large subunit, biosynthetic type [Halobacillus halophilus]CCG44916.1 acetolactate synthase large subunit [Halobacillus halophilus DSM 2266]
MKAEASVKEQTATKTGADLLVESLIEQGVDTLFGYPGGAVLPIYDAIYRAEGSFDHVLPRHEQGAIHAAEGYARVANRAGVVIGTSGPGATNLVTGIADAMMDSIPLVVFTGQVAKGVIGTDAFQESDIMGITTPITKHNYQVQNIEELPRIVKEAFHIATTGRPGPVVVDIPKDISSEVYAKDVVHHFHLPGYQPTLKPNPLQITKLHEALTQAKKPVILTGSGIIHAGASEELRTFVRNYEIPVVSTLLGLGSYPGSDRLSLGMGGMHGTYAANMALYECDLLINIGARFDDRLTGNLKHFAPTAKVAHVDIDPAEIGKNVPTSIPIVSDAKAALKALNNKEVTSLDHKEWLDQSWARKADYPLWFHQKDEDIVPQWLVKKVYDYTRGEAVVTTDVGQHQMWAAQYYHFDEPNRWVTSGGLGTMGYGFPAAIGAQLADMESTCVAIVGDGGFQMTLQELSVLQERGLPVKIIIVNNQALGMVRQWQEKFYDGRFSSSIIDTQPDFVKLAESYQIPGYFIDSPKTLEEVLPGILADDKPAVVDCRVLQSENVYPMIAPGKGLHEMIGVKP